MILVFRMLPLDERAIYDSVICDTISITMRYALLKESNEFCQDLRKYLESWEGYMTIRSDLERCFVNNRNYDRIM